MLYYRLTEAEMSFITVFSHVFVLFVIMITGFVAGKAKFFSSAASKDFSALLLKIATPALIISSMLREFDGELLTDALLCLLIGLSTFGGGMLINYAIARPLRIKQSHRGIWSVATSFTNTGFMGFPMALAVFGEKGLFLAAFINLAQTILIFSCGVRLTISDSDRENKESPLKTMLSPVNISLIIGLVLFLTQADVPTAAEDAVRTVAAIVTPVSMIIVGLDISKYRLSEVIKDRDACISAIINTVFIPLMLLGIFRLIPFREGSIVPGVSVLIMTMPAPSVSQAIAEQYGGDSAFTSHTIFLTSLLCLVTCPAIMTLI